MLKENTGRYTVGQDVYGIAFHYTVENQCTADLLFFYKNNFPDKVSFCKFKVVKHARVPTSSLDDTKNADGYVLLDPKGRIFHNQYPRAFTHSVGNATDEQFSLNLNGFTNAQAVAELNKNHYQPCTFIDIGKVVASVYRGSIDNGTGLQRPEYLKKYKDLYNLIVSTFEEKYPDRKIRIVPVLNDKVDGTSTGDNNKLEAVVMSVELMPA